ncbi:MAG: glycosyl hydrolase 2 galactose-binding domain-containing protein [Acidimicrobiales bacterium]
MPDLFAPSAPRPAPASLVDGIAGSEGFRFHDAHNQPVHQAAPGLLGLIEARLVVERWRPRSVEWLDGTDHFFNHLSVEFDGVAAFAPARRELDAIRGLDAPWPARNALLFRYLDALTRTLERDALAGAGRAPALPARDGDHDLNGIWTARFRAGEEWVDRQVTLPVNWELLSGIDDYAGTMRFTRTFRAPTRAEEASVALRFGGVDYFADVWLNGYHLGGHEGYFGEFTFDVGPYLRDDANVLRVAVTSPNDPAGPGTHVTSGWHDFSPASAFPNRKTVVKGTLGHHDAKSTTAVANAVPGGSAVAVGLTYGMAPASTG